jgi:hypothetical protein
MAPRVGLCATRVAYRTQPACFRGPPEPPTPAPPGVAICAASIGSATNAGCITGSPPLTVTTCNTYGSNLVGHVFASSMPSPQSRHWMLSGLHRAASSAEPSIAGCGLFVGVSHIGHSWILAELQSQATSSRRSGQLGFESVHTHTTCTGLLCVRCSCTQHALHKDCVKNLFSNTSANGQPMVIRPSTANHTATYT